MGLVLFVLVPIVGSIALAKFKKMRGKDVTQLPLSRDKQEHTDRLASDIAWLRKQGAQRPLEFWYEDVDGNVSRRTIDQWYEDGPYIHGKCRTMKAERTFRKDRITQWLSGSDALR